MGGMTIKVQGLTERVEIGELAKLATFLGCNVHIEAGERGVSTPDTRATLYHDTEHTDLELTSLAASVICSDALVRDRSVDDVLADVRRRIEQWHFGDLSKRPSDNRPLGAGPDHDGHND